MGFFDKLKQGLKKTKDSISNQINSVFQPSKKITEELFEELEETLIMADVGVQTSLKICDNLRTYAKKEHIKDAAQLKQAFIDQIAIMLEGGEELNINTSPSVILVIGVNGVGKTTTIGKLAINFKRQGKKVLLAAADTFRAAAIEQLEVWANRAQVDIVKQLEGSDPAAVVFDAIASAKAKNVDIIICDTAGRLHNKKNLMDELAKINRIINRELPDSDKESLLVLDATTGQNAVNQAKQFQSACDISGIILTKLDGTAKGGVVLSIKDTLNVPVKFIGVGEQIDDLQEFNPKAFASALFDLDYIEEDISAENDQSENEEEIYSSSSLPVVQDENITSDDTADYVENDIYNTDTAQANKEQSNEALPDNMDFVLSPNDEISSEQYEESDDYKSDEDLQDEAVNEDDNKQNVFVLASGNAHKLEEFRRVLEPLGITLLSKDDVNAADFDPEETADTFAGNAQIKAEEMAKLTNLPSIADDSGLMIDALNGEPGVYSARYAGENATDEDKCNLILDKLQGLPKRKRKARFVSSICCVFPKTDKIITAEGTCEGRIAFDIRGNNGFGYDPIFIPKKRWDRKTFAEISGNEKDKISHRGNSLREFAYKLSQTLQEDSYD